MVLYFLVIVESLDVDRLLPVGQKQDFKSR